MGLSQGAVLAVESLRRGYGGRVVVDVESLAVREREVLAILGPNGAGKSTLFRLMLLLERPDSGRILLNGRPVAPGDRDAGLRMAGVFQSPHLFAGTALDNAAFGLRARGVPPRAAGLRAREALDWLGVGDRARADVATLSGGEAQRVALARALVLEPEVLLLDEPTAGLDVTVRRRFREDLDRLARERAGAIVLITHDAADAFALADRIAVLDEGRVAQLGTPDEVTLDPATPFIAAVTGAELLLDGKVVSQEERMLVARTAGGATLLAITAPYTPPLGPGAAVHIAYRPEDVVLAPARADLDASPRNRLPLNVVALVPSGGLVRVRLEGPADISALITRQSAEALALEPGTPVTAYLKTAALRAFAAPDS